MAEPRQLFLDAARAARDLMGDPAVGATWDRPSVLRDFAVRGLAGHLARTIDAVAVYLEGPAPVADPIDPARYYATAVTTDIDDDTNRGIRARGEQYAAEGQAAMVAATDDVLDRLAERLREEPADRRIAVFGGLSMTLDDYLVTRIAELLVHTDDLAVSVGLPTPAPDPAAADLVTHWFVTLARRRHGDTAVLRALTRRERDDAEALRVL